MMRRRRTMLAAAFAAVTMLLGGVGVSVASGGGGALTAGRTADPVDGSTAKPMLVRDAEPVVAPIQEVGAQPNIGDPVNGYSYVPIIPFRTFDSRNYADGYEVGSKTTVTYFTVLTDQFNNPVLPVGAVAVTYNLTVTDTSGSGFLGLFPASSSWPGNASINWSFTGDTLNNGGTVAIGNYSGPGQVAVYIGPKLGTVGTDFVMDITGYYI